MKVQIRTASADREKEEELLIFVYEDPYYARLLQTMKVALRLFRAFDVLAKAGETRLLTLDYYNAKNRRVQLYSSDFKLCKFVDPNNQEQVEARPQAIVAGDNFTAQVAIQAFTTEDRRILVSAVDVETRELVHGWLMKLTVKPCEIVSEVEVHVGGGGNKIQRFEFTNPLAQQTRFFASSSDERFMRVSQQQKAGVLLGKGQLGQFMLTFPTPDTGERAVKVLIFLFDKDHHFHQARLLHVFH